MMNVNSQSGSRWSCNEREVDCEEAGAAWKWNVLCQEWKLKKVSARQHWKKKHVKFSKLDKIHNQNKNVVFVQKSLFYIIQIFARIWTEQLFLLGKSLKLNSNHVLRYFI